MATVNVDNIAEMEIIEEAPRRIKIGNRYILVQQMNLHQYFSVVKDITKMYFKYTEIFVSILKIIQADTEEKSKRKNLLNYFIIVIKLEKFKKDTVKLLNKMFPTVGRHLPFQKSYLEKNATINDILQIVFALYTYNFGDVKKNLAVLMESMELRQTEVSQILTSSSKKSSDGEKDKPLKPRFEKLKTMEKDTKSYTEMKVKEVNL